MQNNKIEDILNSINGLQAASPKPFLATRVNAAIANVNNSSENKSITQWLLKPVVAFSIIAIVVLLNLIVLQQTNNTITETEMEESLVNNDITEASSNLWNENNFNK